jgi:hypothetical protein
MIDIPGIEGRGSLPRVVASAVLVALTACGGTSEPPQPGHAYGTPPDLRGRRVVLLPVQQVLAVAGDPDAELRFTLAQAGQGVDWVFEDEVEEVLARSPAIQARTRGLPVGVFMRAQVQRIGDPLFGELRRIAALVDGEAILLPVRASFEPNQSIPGSAPRVRFTTALIEPRSGRVVWFGIEEGGEFPAGDPRGLASAVERLAGTLLWYARGTTGPGNLQWPPVNGSTSND